LSLDGLDNLSIDETTIDIDNLSDSSNNEVIEEEIIGLSGDELDNILNTTEIVESSSDDMDSTTLNADTTETLEESETIDLSNFEADLKEIGTEEIKIENEMLDEEPPVEKINISLEEEEEIYSSLKAEMQKKKEPKDLSEDLKDEVKSVLSYLDKLLDALPDEKIKEFAESEAFESYKKLFDELKIKN
jgi:bisphosphoglycerate-dependent phosphoglycerate mutase